MAVRKWKWLWIDDKGSVGLGLLIRLLNERLKALAEFLDTIGGGSAADEINAVEGYLYNAGDPLVAGTSDWVKVPFSFTITLAEIVADNVGTISINVYASTYPTWDTATLVSAAAPITLAGTKKAHPALTGWTTSFTGGTYLWFVVTGTPSGIRKATVTLELTLPNSVLTVTDAGVVVSGAVGGVLSGTLPNPGFAEDMATQAELNAEATTRATADSTESAARIAGDAAQQAYTDTKVAGLSWKGVVRAATTVAGTLASSFANASVIDGVTLATGDRILIKNQASGSENGIYVVAASGAPTRATDADSGTELVNATCYVSEGTTNADTLWSCTTNAPITLGVTALTFARSTGSTAATIDTAPTNPSATDDEFEATQTGGVVTPTGWTGVNWSGLTAADVNSSKPGALYAECPQNGGTLIHRAIMKAIPAGDFTIVTEVVQANQFPVAASQCYVGIELADGTTAGAGNNVTMFSGYDTTKLTRGANKYAGYTGGSAATYVSTTGLANDRYLRIRRSGTTYFFGWSADLRCWYEPAGVTAATFGFTPTFFGLMCRNDATGFTQKAAFSFFRYAASATAVFGWGVP